MGVAMRSARNPVILFLAASPRGTSSLELDREARDIEEEIERCHPQQFVFKTQWAVTPLGLLRILRRFRPTVVHFAGHGVGPVDEQHVPDDDSRRDVASPRGRRRSGGGLFVHGQDDRAHLVSAEALARLFRAVGSVRLVVLNACYSAELADALLPHVDAVVGMSGRINDKAACAFSAGFYGALANGARVRVAYEQGKTAIGLERWDDLAEAERPQLKLRRDIATPWDMPGPWRRVLGTIGMSIRLGALATGTLGIATVCALLVLMAAVAWRGWSAFGESMLDVRVRQLVVRTSEIPQPVQEAGDVRAVEIHAIAIEGAPLAAASPGPHRVALTGGFLSIGYARAAHADPACQVRFAAIDNGRLEIERATPDGRGCDHEVIVIAGASGIALSIDDAPPVAVSPHTRLALRVEPGTPLTLIAQRDCLALFRPSDGVVLGGIRLEAISADGSSVRLPGGLRSSDSFELSGSVELRELRLDAGQLAVKGALRNWSGRVGRSADWNSAAPWPPSSYCWAAAAVVVLLAFTTLVRALLHWRAWKLESQ
jgi:hypothetical protein